MNEKDKQDIADSVTKGMQEKNANDGCSGCLIFLGLALGFGIMGATQSILWGSVPFVISIAVAIKYFYKK
ncbi:hypothetical protein [Liquorilactobacillus satsumensis]|uniref:hypothetical protein n=1 Tax=Liquorilactobacillus TaxID=2767888 RepID=UPI0021C3D478|nr:hypothetical protein [Liquorilactobacillus satsumensis]MCP9313849.1 hypothetical protein [Liquorilactobacillus satsumensis]MCP9360990.1 hypothetical protein [Liquorilactobacillus satsumensis]